MDLSFANAIRNASTAWSQNRMADAITMAELTRCQIPTPEETILASLTPTLGQLTVIQPELARYGQVGTRLNFYA